MISSAIVIQMMREYGDFVAAIASEYYAPHELENLRLKYPLAMMADSDRASSVAVKSAFESFSNITMSDSEFDAEVEKIIAEFSPFAKAVSMAERLVRVSIADYHNYVNSDLDTQKAIIYGYVLSARTLNRDIALYFNVAHMESDLNEYVNSMLLALDQVT